jgi:hypothetical protein
VDIWLLDESEPGSSEQVWLPVPWQPSHRMKRRAAGIEAEQGQRARNRALSGPLNSWPPPQPPASQASRFKWRPIRFRCTALRLYRDEYSGRVGVAVREERFSEGVPVGGERRPDDSELGVRWLDPSRPIKYLAGGNPDGGACAWLPVILDAAVAITAATNSQLKAGHTGVWIPISDAFWFAEQFEMALQVIVERRACLFSARRVAQTIDGR